MSTTERIAAQHVDRNADDLALVANRFAVAITEPMQDLVDPADPDDPIAKQFMPDVRELAEHPDELCDPIGDDRHSPVPGIVHRYPDRLLLTPIRVCPVYCRFCFRRETVGQQDNGLLSTAELETALDYICRHREVWEVILSGGDPLLLSPRRLRNIVNELNDIDHVKVIRIHTRIPVVEPERIDLELVTALKQDKALFVILHTNHPRELTIDARQACARLIDNGIPMLSQSVLLKGINNDAAVLEELLRTLVENRIKPYYLHHADRARGTSHFRTTIDDGQKIMRQLRGRVSGLCQPEYVLDIPGGHGKVPVGPQWIGKPDPAGYTVIAPNGKTHNYGN